MPSSSNPLPAAGLRRPWFPSQCAAPALNRSSRSFEEFTHAALLSRTPLSDFTEGHVLGLAAGALLPFFEQGRVVLSDVLVRRDPQRTGSLVDPAGRALDFSDVADGS